MTNKILNYNIHDILKIQIAREEHFDLMRGLDLELSYFRSEVNLEPDIYFYIGKFIPSNKDCYLVDHRYYIRNNYFYCKDSLGRESWEVEINSFEYGKTVVNYSYSYKTWNSKALISRFSIETFLLRPLIYYKLSERGYFMIHSAGVSKNGEAYIFPARGGAFKTTFVMDFIKKAKFNYLGDDRVILHRGEVLSFPAHLILFNYIYSNKNNEYLNLMDKIRFVNSLRQNNYYNVNVPIVKSAKLKLVCFIEKTNKSNVIIQKLDLKDAIDKLIDSTKMEMSSISDNIVGFSLGPYYRYMQAYSYVFPESKVAKYWDELKQNYKAILKGIPIYQIIFPEEYDDRVFQEILDVVEGGL